MPINITRSEYFERVKGEQTQTTPAPSDDEEIIEPDNFLYDEDEYDMVNIPKPKEGDFYDEPPTKTRRIFGDDDEFINSIEPIHPTIEEHTNEYLKRGEELSPEELAIVKEHDKSYRISESWNTFIDSHKQAPITDDIEPIKERTETIFKNRYNIGVDKEKITELLIDSYFVYENEDEPEHNSTTIDNTETDTNVEIYHKEGYDVIAFRGTEATHIQDIITDINTFSTRLSSYFDFITPENDLTAHSGFVKAVASVYEEVKANIRNDIYDSTGHSMGSAEAQIFAYVYLIDTGIRPRHLITFGSPRWCIETADTPTSRYNEALDHLRVMNSNDMVSYLPTGDSSLMGMTKFATMGATTGGTVGQYGGGTGASVGLGLGALLGGAMGAMASGGYKHVGVGLLLTANKNAVLDVEGKEVKLINKNFYIIPEDLDLARNPINFDSTLLSNMAQGGLYTLGNNYLTNYIREGTAFAGISPPNIFKEFRNVYNIQFLEKLESDIVKLISDSRIDANSLGRPFFERASKDSMGGLWATAENYLTGQFLKDYESDTVPLKQMKIDIRKNYRESLGETLRPMERMGFMKIIPDEDRSEYTKLYNKVILKAMNAQLESDTQTARNVYALVGLQLTTRLLLDGSRLRYNFNHVQGHLFAQYFHNVGMLPNTIFEGATSYKVEGEGIKYLGFSKNQFVEYPAVQNHILGFMFYPSNQENMYNNKIVVY